MSSLPRDAAQGKIAIVNPASESKQWKALEHDEIDPKTFSCVIVFPVPWSWSHKGDFVCAYLVSKWLQILETVSTHSYIRMITNSKSNYVRYWSQISSVHLHSSISPFKSTGSESTVGLKHEWYWRWRGWWMRQVDITSLRLQWKLVKRHETS